MSQFDTAITFFHACEGLQGWQGCSEYVAPDASFTAQSEPLSDLTTVAAYCEWMAGLGNGPLKGCSYDLHASAWDEEKSTALFFATFHGKHVGEGGPVPATGKETHSHYVYAITVNDAGKVSAMTKIWNAPWAMREMGWS
jgi:hypothetical protein